MPNESSESDKKTNNEVEDNPNVADNATGAASKLQDDSKGVIPQNTDKAHKDPAVEQLPGLTLTDNSKTEQSDSQTEQKDRVENPDRNAKEKEVLDELRDLMDKESAEDRYSGAVLVAKDGEVVFAETRGLADRETGEPITLDTKLRIASMGKMLTGVSTMKLVEDGKLDLDGTLDKYLPDYPNKDVSSKVTIRQLLNHTSGLGDIFTPEYDADPQKFKEIDDYIKANASKDLAFEPGSKSSYSNYGYVLLGSVIEKISGQSYEDFVKKNILEPAGMKDTGMRPEHERVEGRSKGYTSENPPAGPDDKGGPPWKSNADSLPYKPTPAGGSYSTVGDLLRFANALRDNKLISEDSKKLMTTPPGGVAGSYALGFFERKNDDGTSSYGHTGGAGGMSGDLAVFEKSGYTVISLSNLDPPAAMKMSDYVSKRLPHKKSRL